MMTWAVVKEWWECNWPHALMTLVVVACIAGAVWVVAADRGASAIPGTIVGKELVPMSMVLIPVSTGKTVVLTPVAQPGSYRLTVRSDLGVLHSFSVDRKAYDACSNGDRWNP